MSQQKEVARETKTRRQRQEISGHILWPQLADKKERHSRHAKDHHDQISRAKLFLVEQWFENEQINRCGVLQKDRIGGCGFFCCQNEEKQQRRVKQRRQRGDQVQTKAFATREDGYSNCRQQRATE